MLGCDQEPKVLEAVRSGHWDESLRVHVASCSVCRDVVLVSEFLLKENEEAAAQAHLPDAGLVWWKAQLLARREAAQRAVRPIALIEKITGGGLLALVLTGIALNWKFVSSILFGSLFHLPDMTQFSLLAVTGGALIILLGLCLYAVLTDSGA